MRVLVTGITGQVGGALVKTAAPEGVTWIAAGRDRLDLGTPDRIAAQVDALAPDAVVNPAAYTAVDKAETDGETAFRANRDGPAALAAACAVRGIPLIHLSTDYVFDGTGIRPYRPDDPVAPLGVYGASKEAGERAIRETLEDHLILRTAWVYAAEGRNFMNTMLRLGDGKEKLNVVDDQHGTPTAAADIAAAIATLLSARRGGTALRGTFHYTAAGETTWHGFAEAIFRRAERHWGRRPAVHATTSEEYIESQRARAPDAPSAPRPAYSVLDNSALDVALAGVAIVPRRPWEAALEAVLDTRLGPLTETER